jgi:hypothetical protein
LNHNTQLQQYSSDQQVVSFSSDEKEKIDSFVKDQVNTIYYRAIVNNESEMKVKINQLIAESSLTQEYKDALTEIGYSDLDDRSFKANLVSQKKARDQGIGFYLSLKEYIDQTHHINHFQIEAGNHEIVATPALEILGSNSIIEGL